MKKVRESIGVDENNTLEDYAIMEMKEGEVFKHVCNYEGLINYDITIKRWIKQIYKIDLDELENINI
jgi:hypothetical protein